MRPPDNIAIPCPICHERIQVPVDTDGERLVNLRANLEPVYEHVNRHVDTDGDSVDRSPARGAGIADPSAPVKS